MNGRYMNGTMVGPIIQAVRFTDVNIQGSINKCACHVQRTYSDVNVLRYTRILLSVPHNPLRLLGLILQLGKSLSKISYNFLFF